MNRKTAEIQGGDPTPPLYPDNLREGLRLLIGEHPDYVFTDQSSLPYLLGVLTRAFRDRAISAEQTKNLILVLGIRSAEDAERVVPRGVRMETSTEWDGFYELYLHLFEGRAYFPAV